MNRKLKPSLFTKQTNFPGSLQQIVNFSALPVESQEKRYRADNDTVLL